MAKDLKIPITLGPKGQAEPIEGSDLTRQLLLIALRECESDNPFQNLGVDEKFIFEGDALALRSRLELKVADVFDTFERARLAKLATGEEMEIIKLESGVLEMRIKYIDLETGKQNELLARNAGGLTHGRP